MAKVKYEEAFDLLRNKIKDVETACNDGGTIYNGGEGVCHYDTRNEKICSRAQDAYEYQYAVAQSCLGTLTPSAECNLGNLHECAIDEL
jgi:hypothetical protein